MHQYLDILINDGLIPFCEDSPILKLRKQIQDEPLVVRELALRLKELKKIFEHHCINNKFDFKRSALKLFEISGVNSEYTSTKEDFWYPL